MKEGAAVLTLAALPFLGTYLYMWVWRHQDFFPDRYEDACQALGMAAVASLGMLVVAVAVALVGSGSRVRRR